MRNGLKGLIILFGIGLAIGLLFCVLTALLVWLAWNISLPGIFGLPIISYWQALGMTVLVWLFWQVKKGIKLNLKA